MRSIATFLLTGAILIQHKGNIVEYSESVNAKQKSKALFTSLQKQRAKTSYVIKTMTVSTRPTYNFPGLTYHQQQPFQGSPLQRQRSGKGQFFSRTFQRVGKNKCTGIGSSRETQIFSKELAKSNHRASNSEYVEDLLSRNIIPEFFSTSSINETGEKNNFTGENRGDAKK